MNDVTPIDLPADLSRKIADNIRSLRRIRHLSQAELARRVGMRPGPMNAIEQGHHVPSGRVLYRLAEVLQISVDVLLGRADQSEYDESATGSGAGRVKESSVAYVVEAKEAGGWPTAEAVTLPDDPPVSGPLKADVEALIKAFLALEDLCGAQKRAHIPLYLPFELTEPGVELMVQQVRQVLGVGQGVIFDYLELIENAGLRVVFLPMPEPHQSLAFYDADNANAFLFVRADMNVERQLFELVKRLGSIYLHTRKVFGCSDGDKGPLDRLHAARKFAALFLMPAGAVRASVMQLGLGPSDWTYELLLRLKHRFGVSAQSFLIRLKELKLIAGDRAEDFQKRITEHYRQTGNGEPDSTRRILSPNGRFGDLLLGALQKESARDEARAIDETLTRLCVKWRGGV